MDNDWQPETGSSIYYSLRFAPQAFRQSLRLIFAWQQLLREILALATDPGVSRVKLDWWQLELANGAQQQAKHPLAIALQPLLIKPETHALFQEMLQAADRDLRLQSVPTVDDWYTHCDQWGESLTQLLVLASNGNSEDHQKIIGLGRHIEVIHRISSLSRTNPDFHLPLPTDDNLKALTAPSRDRVDTILNDTHCTPVLASAIALAAQTRALDKKLLKHHYQTREQAIDILPITRLWHAWRASSIGK